MNAMRQNTSPNYRYLKTATLCRLIQPISHPNMWWLIHQCYNHNSAIFHLVCWLITVFACKRKLLLCNLCFIHHCTTDNILLFNTIFLETLRLFILANLAGLGKIQNLYKTISLWWANCCFISTTAQCIKACMLTARSWHLCTFRQWIQSCKRVKNGP